MQIVFAVKYRESLISPAFHDRLCKYIWGIIEKKEQKSLAVNGYLDHIHIFVGLSPTVYIPDFIRDIKSRSSVFVNENRLSPKKFHWQEGYGIFSYSRSQRSRVINYILRQQTHHKKETFKNEYFRILDQMGVAFDEKYLFDFFC